MIFWIQSLLANANLCGYAKDDAERLGRERSAKELVDQKPTDEFADKERDIRFGTACCALTVLRYLTDYINQVPLCVMAGLYTSSIQLKLTQA